MDQMPARGNEHYPLDMNRIFELTFSLFRFNWRIFVAIALVVMIPVSLILAASTVLTSSAATDWLAQLQQVALGREFHLSNFPWVTLAFALVVGIGVGVGAVVAQAAITHGALKTYGGAPIETSASIRFALGRVLTIAGAYFLTFLASLAVAFIGALLASVLFLATASGGRIVPGIGVFLGLIVFVAAFAALIFLAIRWTLIVPVLVVEGGGAIDALRRSWRLISGSSWRVLGYVLVFGLLVGIVELLLSFLLTLLINPASLSITSIAQAADPYRVAILNFGTSLIGALLMPFTTIGLTLLYLDLRFRKGEPVPQPGVQDPILGPAERPEERRG